MIIILILFFLSLAGIILMIGNRLILLKEKPTIKLEENFLTEIPHLENARHLTIKSIKKYSYLTLVAIIRFYVKLSHLLKHKYQNLKEKINKRLNKNQNNSTTSKVKKPEVSKFLRMISEYKHKIRKIKHQIKEEEGIK